jgi:thiamine biosynthesis lipoprotein
MGTCVEIVARACKAAPAESAVERAFREFERLERAFSRFDPRSELSRVNREADRGPVAVADETFAVVERALAYSASSGGCFSIALAPLVRLWSACEAENRAPGDREVAEALARSDYRDVRLDAAARTIAFSRPRMGLDLGGFVKGYAVDLAVAALREGGVAGAFVSAGESSVAGFSDDASPWRVGVRHPSDGDELLGVITLAGRALSTSGTGERGFEVAGRRVSHLVDPRTGEPLEGSRAATAVTDSAERAEVASKMLVFLGCERAVAACDANGWDVEGFGAVADERTGRVRYEYSSDFPVEIVGPDQHDTVPALQE